MRANDKPASGSASRWWRAGLLTAAALCLAGFDSYKVPVEQLLKDGKLRKQAEALIRGGGDTALYANHYLIAKRCLIRAGVEPEVAEAMARKTSDIDFDNVKNRGHYEAKNHCDRAMEVTHHKAFAQSLEYHRQRVSEAWNSLSHGDLRNVKKILPRALHVQGDFFSHSNYVDLPPATREELMGCWTRYRGKLEGESVETPKAIAEDKRCMESGRAWNSGPGQLLITGYDPSTADPYRPPGDAYPHGLFAKDNGVYGAEAKALAMEGKSKYEAAEDAALTACVASMAEFKQLCELDSRCRQHVRKMFRTGEPQAP